MLLFCPSLLSQENFDRANEAYVKLTSETDPAVFFNDYFDATEALEYKQAFVTDHENLNSIYLVTFQSEEGKTRALENQSVYSAIEYAESVPMHEIFYTPNDIHAQQYNVQTIQAEAAWDITTGDANITIAVVDDAFRMDHEDLAPAWYTNPGEIAGNGIDDDGNGFTDDVIGWDAADADPDPNPPLFDDSNWSHGTHVAGIAGGATDNNLGTASSGFNCSIIPVKCTNASPSVTHGYEGVDYAIAAGADIISMSWGGSGQTNTGQALMTTAFNLGIVCVAAAGNDNTSIPMYPASYDYVISVGATDVNDVRAGFSNYGATIDVMAPGVDIISSVAGGPGNYSQMSGTSMACPLVSGVCGLMLSLVPNMDPLDLEYCLESGCDNIDASNPNFVGDLGAGRVNALQALICASAVYASFEVSSQVICPGGQVQFTDASFNDPTSWQWTFPGGSPGFSTQQNPLITYNTVGTYDVTLYVANADGDHTITLQDYITVALPTAELSGSSLIVDGMDAWLYVDLTGTPPWSLTISDGVNETTYNGIMESPFQVAMTPSENTSYFISDFSSSQCDGTAIGEANITVLDSPGAFQCYFTGWYGDDLDNRGRSAFVDPIDNSIYAGGLHNGEAAIFHLLPNGELDWVKSYSNVGNVRTLTRAPNGDIVALGTHVSNYHMFRTDNSGNLLWAKSYDWGNDRYPRMVRSLGDTYYLAGWSNFGGVSDNVAVVKLDANGDVLWERFYDHVDDQLSCVTPTDDGGCVVGGGLHIFGGNLNYFLLELDADGNEVVKQQFDSDPVRDDDPFILKTSDGGYAVAGRITNGSFLENFIHKMDANFNQEWSYRLSNGNDDHHGLGVAEDADGNIYFMLRMRNAANESVLYFHKFDAAGNQIFEKVGADLGWGSMVFNSFNGSESFVIATQSHNGDGPFGDIDANVMHVNTDLESCVLEPANTPLTAINWVASNWPAVTYPSAANVTDFTNQVNEQPLIWDYEIPCSTECNNGCEVVALLDLSTDSLCGPGDVDFENLTLGADSIQWYVEGNLVSTADNYTHYFDNSGSHQVVLVAYADSCFDLLSEQVWVNLYDIGIVEDQLICSGDSAQLWVGAPVGFDVLWSPAASLSDPEINDPLASPDQSTQYNVTLTDPDGCEVILQTQVDIDPSCCVSWLDIVAGPVCMGEELVFENQSLFQEPATFEWQFQNTNLPDYIGLEPSPLSVDSAMAFDLVVTLNDLCGTYDTTIVTGFFPLPAVSAGEDTLMCNPGNLVLGNPDLAYHAYLWSPSDNLNDATLAQPTAFITEPTQYVLTVVNEVTGCAVQDTLNVELNTLLDLGGDYTGCLGDTLVLSPEFFADTTLWSNGSSESSIIITESGTYSLIVSNACGDQSDAIYVLLDDCECPAYVPNAFTPDFDGKNDAFFPVISCQLEEYQFEIWNRWGEMIFNTNDQSKVWFGNAHGGQHYVPDGVYIWRLRYKGLLNPEAEVREVQGHVTVFR